MDSMDSCHSFNLNDQPPTESRNEEPDPNHLKQHQLSFSSLEEGGNLAEVMAEIQRENLKIVKSLAGLFEKYDEIKHQLTRLLDEDDNDDNTLPKKRKAVCLSDSCISDDVCFSRARLMSHKPKISTAFIRVDESDTSLAVKDGYQWRKYGQKVTRDNPSPRAYFKCSFAPLCPVKKKVQRSVDDSTILVVTYEGMHNHKKPPSGATLSPLAADVLIEADDDDVAAGMLQPRLVQQMASSLTKDNAFTSALAAAIYSQVLQQKTSF